jgi:hypothetical protein
VVPLALLILGAAVAPLAGQTATNHLYDKFQVGGYLSSILLNSNVRVDGSGGKGEDIDAEDDLGLSRTKVQPRFDLRWRPGRRHELEVGYQFARRTGEKVITRDFDFGDTSFTAGLRVRSRFDTDQAFLNYRFAFMAREKTQVGVGLGLGALFLGTGLDAMASIASGGKADSVAFGTDNDLLGPTASLGAYGRFQVGSAWYLEADFRGVKVAIDRYDASVVEGGAAVRYFVSQAVALEAGYGLSTITVEIGPKGDTSWSATGKIKYSLQHLRFGVTWTP